MNTAETRFPHLLTLSFIATPVLFFLVVALVGPLTHFASYLFIAWTIAAVASASCFAVDRSFREQFSTSERLAILAGNGMVAFFVASTGYMALAFGG